MLFNSIEFAIFLPIVFLLYWYGFNRRVVGRNLFIIAASYLFYGWWDWRFLVLIAFTSLSAYLSGIAIGRCYGAGNCRAEDAGEACENPRRRRRARAICALNIVVNLGILCVFKYYNFFMTEFAHRFLGGDTSGLLIKNHPAGRNILLHISDAQLHYRRVSPHTCPDARRYSFLRLHILFSAARGRTDRARHKPATAVLPVAFL